MRTEPLNAHFGLAVEGVSLRDVTADHLYPDIRALFEEHTALLFRAQNLTQEEFTSLARLFGPLENRDAMSAGRDVPFTIFPLSNETKDGLLAEDSLKLLNLQGNMLWHTDSTFLPTPALVNLLTARVVPSSGGQTEIASTRAAWADMPEELKTPLRDAIVWHRLSHSRSKISTELAALPMMNRWPDRPWPAVWTNPANGAEALYIASHAFAIEGMGLEEAQALIDAAMAFCTQDKYVYSHEWQPGDVLIWDERATVHRGRPWPYDQPRRLESICCSATDADGLASMRIV